MNKDKAASEIENQIITSFDCKVDRVIYHPIRLIQASKSLIGLNLDNPNQRLINFSGLYLNEKLSKKHSKTKPFKNQINEVINIHDLENAILSKDRFKISDSINQLSKVSSSLHILEYLIEISLKENGSSFLVLWSIYRSIFFIGERNLDDFRELIIEVVLYDSICEYPKSNTNIEDIILIDNLTIEDIDLYSHLIELKHSNLVRSEKLLPLADKMINRFSIRYDLKSSSKKINVIESEFNKNGRAWILDYINEINPKKITYEFILFLDSIRCLLKYLNVNKHKYVFKHFERLVKNFNI